MPLAELKQHLDKDAANLILFKVPPYYNTDFWKERIIGYYGSGMEIQEVRSQLLPMAKEKVQEIVNAIEMRGRTKADLNPTKKPEVHSQAEFENYKKKILAEFCRLDDRLKLVVRELNSKKIFTLLGTVILMTLGFAAIAASLLLDIPTILKIPGSIAGLVLLYVSFLYPLKTARTAHESMKWIDTAVSKYKARVSACETVEECRVIGNELVEVFEDVHLIAYDIAD